MQRNDDERKANMTNPAAKYTNESRRKTADCAVSTGGPISECRRELDLNSKTVNKWVIKRRRELSSQPDPKAKPRSDLVRRDFTSPVPTYKLMGGITYLCTGEGWLYLVTVIDPCTRMVVGWSLSDRMTTGIAVVALESA